MWSLNDLIDAEAVLDAFAELDRVVSEHEQAERARAERRNERVLRAGRA